MLAHVLSALYWTLVEVMWGALFNSYGWFPRFFNWLFKKEVDSQEAD